MSHARTGSEEHFEENIVAFRPFSGPTPSGRSYDDHENQGPVHSAQHRCIAMCGFPSRLRECTLPWHRPIQHVRTSRPSVGW